MSDHQYVTVPVELAELLHATLGPLGDVLDQEGHDWAPMVKRVLSEYVTQRDAHVVRLHGRDELKYVHHATYQACELVHRMVGTVIAEEEDFLRWDSELAERSNANEADPA